MVFYTQKKNVHDKVGSLMEGPSLFQFMEYEFVSEYSFV
jgi:hypothetical protein